MFSVATGKPVVPEKTCLWVMLWSARNQSRAHVGLNRCKNLILVVNKTQTNTYVSGHVTPPHPDGRTHTRDVAIWGLKLVKFFFEVQVDIKLFH